MRQCDDETRHPLLPLLARYLINFLNTNKSTFTPHADRKIIPCLGKNCDLPRKIFFLLIVAKTPSPPLSQKYKNIFTSNITLTPATCKGTHIFRLEFLFLSNYIRNLPSCFSIGIRLFLNFLNHIQEKVVSLQTE